MPIVPAFTSALDVRKLAPGKWVLLADLRYRSVLLQAELAVPQGFVTDFASVPRLPLTFLAAGDRGHRAAVVHDWLYQRQLYQREQCDAVFDEALIAEGEPSWVRRMMAGAVRLFGAKAYRTGPRRLLLLGNGLLPICLERCAPDQAP